MQDSSANPYIPQESEEIRQKVYEHQSPLGRVVKILLIITGATILVLGIALFFVVPRTTTVDSNGRHKLADALQPPDQTLKRVNVSSQAGFSLNYDNRVYQSYAEVGADDTAGTSSDDAALAGQTYENNDLRVARVYNYVRIRPIVSADTSRALEPIPPQLEVFATVTSKDLATAAAVPANKNLSQLSLFVQLDSTKRKAASIADDGTVVTINASNPVTTTIGSVQYQEVKYTTTNSNYRIADVKYDDCYYTIQYDQPYSVCVSGVRPSTVSAASLVEQVFYSLAFTQPQTQSSTNGTSSSTTKSGAKSTSSSQTTVNSSSAKATSASIDRAAAGYPLVRLAVATTNTSGTDATDSNNGDSSESALLTVTPEYYGDGNSLAAIAKTQPSVVRVGTLYCADLSLQLQSGDTDTTLTNACDGNVSSGVIVSKDGYIATTGHAIRSQKKAAIGGYINFAASQNDMLDRLHRVLNYLLDAKIILQSDADYLVTGAQTGDQEALAKIENIGSMIPDNFVTAANEKYSYAIQPTSQPMVLNTSSATPSFAYSDTVLQAKYIASNYDATKSTQYTFDDATPSTDVGLLKIDGSYPNVPIAASSTVKTNDIVNTLGFPAYADGSLTVTSVRNQPIATSSKIQQVYNQGSSQLIQTNNPVLPGNDGAPVVDAQGQLIGLAVYGLSYCPNQSCFANGTVRPVAELTKLLGDNNITLQTNSPATATWSSGIDQYMRGNYAAASGSFGSAVGQYAFNAWAAPLQKLASANQGTNGDTSLMNTLQTVMIVVMILLVVATIILAIIYMLHRRRLSQMRVGHYGAAAQNVTPVMQPGASPAVASPTATDQPAMPSMQPVTIEPAQPVIVPKQPAESPILPIHEQPATTPAPVPPTSQPEQPSAQVPPAPDDQTKPKDPFYS